MKIWYAWKAMHVKYGQVLSESTDCWEGRKQKSGESVQLAKRKKLINKFLSEFGMIMRFWLITVYFKFTEKFIGVHNENKGH